MSEERAAPLRRDLDLVREILLAIEEGQRAFLPGEAFGNADPGAVTENLRMLVDGGLVDLQTRNLAGAYYVRGLTWKGADFIDTVRDDEVWKRTKTGAEDRRLDFRHPQ